MARDFVKKIQQNNPKLEIYYLHLKPATFNTDNSENNNNNKKS